MPTYAQLVAILKANEIRGYFHYTKSKLADFSKADTQQSKEGSDT